MDHQESVNSKTKIREALPHDLPTIIEYTKQLKQEIDPKTKSSNVSQQGQAIIKLLLEKDNKFGFILLAEASEADDGSGQTTHQVGMITVVYQWSDWRNSMIYWIQAPYVDQQWRGRGVFTSLIQRVQMIGEKKGYRGVRIIFKQFPNVNFKAILNKAGFAPSPYYFYLTKYEGK